MRLLHSRLCHLRQHGELQLQFAPGLTLIAGANETGKSTLVEALHRALFLRASATGAPVEVLQPRSRAGSPLVELGFEAAGVVWTLSKRFSGASGQVALRGEDGTALSGPAAEEHLAKLLGVGATLGSRQAGSQLPSRWAHLWVMQGRAGDDLLAQGGSCYDLDTLVAQLEQRGGGALQSPRDQAVVAQLEAELALTLTAVRGEVRRGSPLGQARLAQAAAEVQEREAEARLAATNEAFDALAACTEAINDLRQQRLPALQEQRRRGQAQQQRLQELHAQLLLQRTALEPQQLRLAALEADAQELALQKARRAALEQHQQQGQRSLRDLEVRLQLLEDQQRQASQERQALDQRRQALVQRGQRVQRLAEQARLQVELEQLERQRQQRQQWQAEAQALQTQLQALAAPPPQQLQELRRLEARWREAQVRHQALAAAVELLAADQPVLLNGIPLQPGDQRQLSEAFELQVGSGVQLRITPGGGEALASGATALAAARQALDQALQPLGLPDLATAEARALEREPLERALEGRRQLLASGPAAQHDQQHQALRQRLMALEAELAALPDPPPPGPDADADAAGAAAWPTGQEALEALHRQLQADYTALQGLWRQGEAQAQAQARELEQLRSQRAAAATALATWQSEGQAAQQACQRLLERHGSAETLQSQRAALQAQVAAALAQLTALEVELRPLEQPGRAAELERLDAEQQRLEAELTAMVAAEGAARQRCESMAADDPQAALEQARAEREQAAALRQGLEQRLQAQRLLLQLFAEAQADLSARYSEPLAAAASSYLQPLLGEGARCRLQYDRSSGFTGLQLQRGADSFALPDLSGGMREQLMAALRLAMADALKGAHDGCLPLVFDDAFTNSDPQRVAQVQAMLRLACDRGLQLIVLSCDPAPYRAMADHTISLDPA